MTASSELKLKNAQYRQQVIEKQDALSKMPLRDVDLLCAVSAQTTRVIVEVGSTIAEQICELREAVERLTDSLPKSDTKPEVKS
jgi:hypothetical protein